MSALPGRARISLLLVVALSAGCTAGSKKMYDGARLAPEQECRVRGEDSQSPSGKPPRIRIRYVDGQSTITAFVDHEAPPEVVLKPGRHDLAIQYNVSDSSLTMKFRLDCEAGAEYVAKAKLEGYRARIWLENARTGAPAGELLGR